MNFNSEPEKNKIDPFAADIFASHTETAENILAAETEKITAPETAQKNLWSEKLPRILRSDIDWDNLWRNLSPVFFNRFSRSLADKLAQLLSSPDDKKFEFSFVRKREINRKADFSAEGGWWINVSSGGAEIYFEIDEMLAVWLVDAAFDARKNDENVVSRPLTATELAVLEFLAVNLAHEANLSLHAPQIRFRTLSKKIPTALRQLTKSDSFSLLVLESETPASMPPSVIKIFLTPEVLKSLQTNNNQSSEARRRIVQTLPEQVKTARVRFVCGSAELTFGELASLENGDVVLLENQGLAVRGETVAGRAEILLGDGGNQKITGELKYFDLANGNSNAANGKSANGKFSVRRIVLNNSLQIVIENFAETEITPFDKIMTETNENLINQNADENNAEEPANGDDGNGLQVENLLVSLRVELEARRLSLSEISGLRENQTLELGIRPTDEVNILIDDRLVGRGELVALEDDRLGVQITKIMR